MLSTPRAGWTTITIGEWSDRASYLTDVPMDLLNGFIEYPDVPFVVEFDAEGWEFEVVINQDFTNMIKYNDIDDIEVYKSVYISKQALALEVANDIELDLDGWSGWFGLYDESDMRIFFRRKNQLAEKITQVRELYGGIE